MMIHSLLIIIRRRRRKFWGLLWKTTKIDVVIITTGGKRLTETTKSYQEHDADCYGNNSIPFLPRKMMMQRYHQGMNQHNQQPTNQRLIRQPMN